MNILNTFKNKKVIIIFIIVLVLILIVIKSTGSKQTNNEVVPTKNPVTVNYNNLTIGGSTKEDVYQKLGSPITEKDVNGVRIIEFKSNNPNYNNELSFESDRLNFVKEIISPSDKIDISNLENKYGTYLNVLYGSTSNLGFDLYIYPEKGIAYIGNQYIGDVIEIWYFPPTDIKSFREMYAKEYFETRQPAQ